MNPALKRRAVVERASCITSLAAVDGGRKEGGSLPSSSQENMPMPLTDPFMNSDTAGLRPSITSADFYPKGISARSPGLTALRATLGYASKTFSNPEGIASCVS